MFKTNCNNFKKYPIEAQNEPKQFFVFLFQVKNWRRNFPVLEYWVKIFRVLAPPFCWNFQKLNSGVLTSLFVVKFVFNYILQVRLIVNLIKITIFKVIWPKKKLRTNSTTKTLCALLKMFVILQYFNGILLPKCNVKLHSSYCKVKLQHLWTNFLELQYKYCEFAMKRRRHTRRKKNCWINRCHLLE